MTILDVARQLQVSWDVIKDIQKRNLRRGFSRPKLRDLTLIALHEITIGHGHQYLTVVLDLQSGAVIFVGEGQGTRSGDFPETTEYLWSAASHFQATL